MSKSKQMQIAREIARMEANEQNECRDDAHDIARQAAGGRVMRHPLDLVEFADRIGDHDRNTQYGFVTEQQRAFMASGMPIGDLTRRCDGKSVIEYDVRYRLDKAA